jgi:hypothetical protein
LHVAYEAITSPSECLYITRFIRRLPQYVAKSLDGRVDTVVELDHGVVRPQLVPDFFAKDHLTRSFQ